MEELAEGVYVETGYQGVNVGAVATKQGIIAIDAPSYPRQAREWATKLHRLKHPVQYVILTDSHGDRVINARWFHAPMIAHQGTAEKLMGYDKRFPQSLLDSLIARSPESSRDLNGTSVERPTFTFTQNFSLVQNGRVVQIMAAPGPTLNSTWIYLPEQKILFTGDTLTTQGPPMLTEGSCQQWLSTLEQLQTWSDEQIISIVPGRGPITDLSSIQPLYRYLKQMWDCVRSHITDGRPKEETAVYLPQFLACFPHPNLPVNWVQQQIKLSLDRVYDEVQLAMR